MTTNEKLGVITVGTRLAWTDYTGQACVGECIDTDDKDVVYPWHVVDQNGCDEWIGPRNEPHPVETPTAWTTERPTEPGWYWYREGDERAECVEVLTIGGQSCAFFAGNECEEQVHDLRGKWQRAEPNP